MTPQLEQLIKHYESLHDGDLREIGLQPKMDSDLGTSYVTTTSGTNWSSAILTAPTDRKQYTTIRTLEN